MSKIKAKIKRPFPVKLYNLAGQKINVNAPWANLNENELIKSAKRKTGLTDFGDERFIVPFQKLLSSIKTEARLHPFGRIMLRIRMIDILSTRLKVQHFFSKNPEIREIELSPITFITGLQRTGTTKLHRLLSQDPEHRSLLSWEVLSPVPPPNFQNGAPDKRIAEAKLKEKYIRYLAPEFYKIHAVEYDAPEEEILLLDNAFLSTTSEAMFNIPTYAAWLEEQDQIPAYAYLKQQLQLLQWQKKRKRWILKTPHHLEFLPALTTIFPDAKIIQTHRDPRKTLASLCSLVFHTRRMFSDHVDPIEIGAHWSRKTNRMVEKGLAFRKSNTKTSFLDISYYDLIENPLEEMKKIYAFMETSLKPETVDQLRAELKVNVPNKYGKHEYRLEDYGLTYEKIDPGFQAYRNYFSIKFE